jgi:hypothetical protein
MFSTIENPKKSSNTFDYQKFVKKLCGLETQKKKKKKKKYRT